MPANDRLTEFAAVAATGNISSAARRLELPRATLSRRLSSLEAELGVRLLHRTTRKLVLTPAGEELYRRARRIVADADEAWRAVRRLDDVPRGLLRVSLTANLLGEMCVAFAKEFPEVKLEVRSTSRHVDLIGEGVDVAVRFGPVKDQSLIVRRVFEGRRVVVGNPAYLKQHGTPTKASDLRQHACMMDFAGDFVPSTSWPLLSGGSVKVDGPIAANDLSLAVRAARAGVGLALLPRALVAASIERGELVVLLEDVIGSDASCSIVYADREFIEPKVRAFVDRAVAALTPRPD